MRFEERFTELFSSRQPGDKSNGSYGSGFLLGRGIILTARHVIAPPDWGPVPPVLDISARPIRSLQPSTDWLDADLLWPQHRDLGQGGPDVALIRLRDIPKDMQDDTLPLLGSELDEQAGGHGDYSMDVYSVGFPKFTLVGAGSRRDTAQISGITKPFAALVSQSYKIDEINFGTRTGGPPNAAFDWVGFSGAPLLLRGRYLIGVVVTSAQNGMFDFRAIRLEPLLARNDFRAALEGAATVMSETAQAEAPPIERLVCLLDRDDQESDFINAYKRCCPKPQVGAKPSGITPIICLLPGAGEYRHAAEDMADRLSLKTLPDLDWAPNTTAFQWLDWPPPRLNPVDAVARLRGSLWNALCGTGDAPGDPEQFRALWKDNSRSRLFRSDLTQVPLNGSTAEVLAAWSTFFTQLGSLDGQAPGHLLLLGATLEDALSWRSQATSATSVVIEALTELDQCNPIQLARWLNERLPSRVAPIHKRIIELLEKKLTQEFPNLFYMRELKRRVGQLVQEGFHA